jgi:hypothetical protein
LGVVGVSAEIECWKLEVERGDRARGVFGDVGVVGLWIVALEKKFVVGLRRSVVMERSVMTERGDCGAVRLM